MRIALAFVLAALTFAPAAPADHGHNCVWTGGAWVGQGLCPGMPGFTPHTATPTAEPTVTSEPTVTTPAPTQTTPPVTPEPTSEPAPTTTAPAPTTTAPSPTSTAPSPTPSTSTTIRPTCVWSSGQWLGVNCPGQPTFPPVETPAPVVGPVVETDIVLYAPEVNPARILR